MKISRLGAPLAACILASAAAGSAGAATTLYTDLAAWSVNATGLTTGGLPDPPSPGFLKLGTGDVSVTYDDIIYATDAELGAVDLFSISPTFSGDTGSSLRAGFGFAVDDQLVNLRITLPRAVTAFSFYYASFQYPATLDVGLSTGETLSTFSTIIDGSTRNFFGVTSSEAFTSVLITSTADALAFRGATYGDAGAPGSGSAAPEPAGWALMILGVGAAGAMIRRRRAHDLRVIRAGSGA